jgi:hypothetical protein
MSDHGGTIVNKRMSFFASIAWGLSLIVIAAIGSATSLGLYALNVADRKSDTLSEFVESVLGTVVDGVPEILAGVPEILDNLPQFVGETVAMRRDPGYLDHLDIELSIAKSSRRGDRMEPVLIVHNTGEEMITWLTVRVVVRDKAGSTVHERSEWIATPVTFDNDCPGPLMPNSTRRISVGSFRGGKDVTAEVEITDIRVWDKDQYQSNSAKELTALTG